MYRPAVDCTSRSDDAQAVSHLPVPAGQVRRGNQSNSRNLSAKSGGHCPVSDSLNSSVGLQTSSTASHALTLTHAPRQGTQAVVQSAPPNQKPLTHRALPCKHAGARWACEAGLLAWTEKPRSTSDTSMQAALLAGDPAAHAYMYGEQRLQRPGGGWSYSATPQPRLRLGPGPLGPLVDV